MNKFDPVKFKGIFVALNACYDKNGNVSKKAAEDICKIYAGLGVKGIYVCGSTGEGFLMSTEERKTLAEAVMGTVGDRMTVIVHVGAAATHDAVELAKHAESCKAHAISAVPSVYYKLSEDSIENHWDRIMESADLPFFIYNIPQLTGYDLSMKLFSKMIMKDRVCGIKNSSISTYQIQQFKSTGGKDFIVFNGPDEQYLAGRLMGADAGIGGTYGCMPELFLKLEECIASGRLEEAKAWQERINGIINELKLFPSMYGACKTIIKKRFTDIGNPRLPILPVPEDYPGIAGLAAKIESYCKTEV